MLVKLEKLGGACVKIINQLSRGAGIFAVIPLLAMVLITVVDVFLRYAFRAPITGSVELVEYLMVVAGFLGMAWCAVKGGHLKVDMILDRLPPRLQAIIDSTTLFLATMVVFLAAWQGFAQARYAHLYKISSDVTEIPAYPFYIATGIGYALLFLAMVTLLAQLIAKARKR